MTFNFFKIAIVCLLLSFSTNLFAQKDFQGKAYYQSKTSVDISNFDRPGTKRNELQTV